MHEHGTEDLLGDIEGPDFDRALRPFSRALPHQGQHREETERALDKEREGAEETAFSVCDLVGGCG